MSSSLPCCLAALSARWAGGTRPPRGEPVGELQGARTEAQRAGPARTGALTAGHVLSGGGQIVAWYTWRHSYRRTEVEAGLVDETTHRKDVRYLSPSDFPGNLWEWFAAQCQARYGADVNSPALSGAQCA